MKRFFKVCASGSVAFTTQVILFNCLRFWLPPEYANSLAVEAAILTNFFINHLVVFHDRHQHNKIFKRLLIFNTTCLFSLVVQFFFVRYGIRFFGSGIILDNIYVLMGIGVGAVFNYICYLNIIWRQPEKNNTLLTK